ncbi:YjfB family protein [Legionella sp. km772]|uniref:YjfB family protein n=1 Tax=Legionella sp. km772 TaxID=2498111 RepID=UPI000F8D18EA|nr:YjfB family protein [Legionella sp. km772]RUR13345.1 putative motility protein [Legionella sp. km772]
MDVSSIASAVSATSPGSLAQQAGVAILKKALDSEASASLQLINSIKTPTASNLPSNLGQNINVAV